LKTKDGVVTEGIHREEMRRELLVSCTYDRSQTSCTIQPSLVVPPLLGYYHLNDDKSPLIDLLSCIVCKKRMKIEKSMPDSQGLDIIQYRCQQCGSIERVRLFRRSRDAASGLERS
jgi:hypothetical protein